MAKTPSGDSTPDTPDAAVTAEAVAQPNSSELVYVCNPTLHKDADPKPAPGRVTRAWLDSHRDKGWVECDANGESKES